MIGVEGKDLVLYKEDISRTTLNKALKYFRLEQLPETLNDRYFDTSRYTGMEIYA
jgi:hypothetical protein